MKATIDPIDYLSSCDIIDHEHPQIKEQAEQLKAQTPLLTAIQSFRFVRDKIPHCKDIRSPRMPLRASETLSARTGLCYAKSHLLAALLRQNNIASGLGYMRLVDPKTESGYSLHCFNNIYLEPYGWIKADSRGNNQQVRTDFDPPGESLAHYPDLYQGEYFLTGNYITPLPCVSRAYQSARSIQRLRKHLPDDH